jgi:hypothetical protein
MMRRVGALVLLVLLSSCRTYDYYPRITDGAGLVGGDQFARYGREQAQSVAIGRQLAQARAGDTPDEKLRQTEAATAYAKGLPDVVDVVADTQAGWLTVSFKSGWRTAILPLADGKSPAETPNLPAAGNPPPAP